MSQRGESVERLSENAVWKRELPHYVSCVLRVEVPPALEARVAQCDSSRATVAHELYEFRQNAIVEHHIVLRD